MDGGVERSDEQSVLRELPFEKKAGFHGENDRDAEEGSQRSIGRRPSNYNSEEDIERLEYDM